MCKALSKDTTHLSAGNVACNNGEVKVNENYINFQHHLLMTGMPELSKI